MRNQYKRHCKINIDNEEFFVILKGMTSMLDAIAMFLYRRGKAGYEFKVVYLIETGGGVKVWDRII